MRKLHLDIETSPNTAHVWGLFKQTVSINQLMESSYVLCWAAKWDGERKVHFARNNDKEMLTKLWDLLDEADVVVHYNGKRFDIPTVNKEFALEGLMPPAPYKQIDLLQVVRHKFKFPSNKLDYVAQAFNLGKKHPHEGHSLWVKCMNEDKAAWKRMETYNKQDVQLLEKLYARILPWIDRHPNTGVYISPDKPVCTNCGSSHIVKKGTAVTNTQMYQRYRCNKCGTALRSRFTETPKEVRRNILTQEVL